MRKEAVKAGSRAHNDCGIKAGCTLPKRSGWNGEHVLATSHYKEGRCDFVVILCFQVVKGVRTLSYLVPLIGAASRFAYGSDKHIHVMNPFGHRSGNGIRFQFDIVNYASEEVLF